MVRRRKQYTGEEKLAILRQKKRTWGALSRTWCQFTDVTGPHTLRLRNWRLWSALLGRAQATAHTALVTRCFRPREQ